MEKVKREIIEIDEEKCNGCGLCIPNCPEGALQIIDGKARLISDLFCDGLGACIGECPLGAISVVKREAEQYDERKVMENIVKQGPNVIKAHLEHLKDHHQHEYLMEAIGYLQEQDLDIPVEAPMMHQHSATEGSACGCPGSKLMDLRVNEDAEEDAGSQPKAVSKLSHWPVQIKLVPPFAPFLKDADLLIAADCVPFTYAGFHEDFLKGKTLLVGCPKLDDAEYYQEKITQMLKVNNIKSITILHMEVPCCFGLIQLVKNAITASGKDIPLKSINISVTGEIKPEVMT